MITRVRINEIQSDRPEIVSKSMRSPQRLSHFKLLINKCCSLTMIYSPLYRIEKHVISKDVVIAKLRSGPLRDCEIRSSLGRSSDAVLALCHICIWVHDNGLQCCAHSRKRYQGERLTLPCPGKIVIWNVPKGKAKRGYKRVNISSL